MVGRSGGGGSVWVETGRGGEGEPGVLCAGFLESILVPPVKGRDGVTAFQRENQCKCHPRAIPAAWEEKVLFMEVSKKKVQLTDKLTDGIFLGVKDGIEEVIFGTPSGCLVCRTVKRRPREDAADPVFFNRVHCGSK